MYSNKLYSPLRYPGGKSRFAGFVGRVIAENGLSGGEYLEPYAGGAAIALELLIDGHVSAVHINDADPALYAFWLAATRHNRKLRELVRSTPLTMDQWHYWRSVMLGSRRAGIVGRGFATLFMNRTNRSGILKGGVIGGLAQGGEYSLDARFNREQLDLRLKRIEEFSDGIVVYGEDAGVLLRRCHRFLPRRSLVYLDPPYYEKGQGLYRNFYEHADHLSIARIVQSKRFTRPWMVSYDDVSPIREMYAGTRTLRYGVHYTAQRKYNGGEVMFFSHRVLVPRGDTPACAA